MLEFLKQIDFQVFIFLNGMHSAFFDPIMVWLSSKTIWIPMYLFFVFLLWKQYGKTAILIVSFAIPLILLSDMGSVHLFKNAFMRLRPCHTKSLEGIIHLVKGYCGGPYGFVSSHASNTFAIAVFINYFLKSRYKYFTLFIFFWCTAISYSRIYLGAHFPGDVICGAAWGTISAIITIMLFSVVQKRFLLGKKNV